MTRSMKYKGHHYTRKNNVKQVKERSAKDSKRAMKQCKNEKKGNEEIMQDEWYIVHVVDSSRF